MVHAWIKFFEFNGTDHARLLLLATGFTDDTQKNNSRTPNKTTEHRM